MTDALRSADAPSRFERARNPLNPYRPPDHNNYGKPPMNFQKHVSLPRAETGLRAVPTYRSPPTTPKMFAATSAVLDEVNTMLSSDLKQLRRSVHDASQKLTRLEARASKKRFDQPRCHSSMDSRRERGRMLSRRQAGESHPLTPVLVGWDPDLQAQLPFGTQPSQRSHRSFKPALSTYPAGPLSKFGSSKKSKP